MASLHWRNSCERARSVDPAAEEDTVGMLEVETEQVKPRDVLRMQIKKKGALHMCVNVHVRRRGVRIVWECA